MDYATLVESALDEQKAPLALKEILKENPSLRKVLEALKQGKDEQVTSYIDRNMADIDSTYPTSALIELFKQVSKISGSKQFNTLTKKIAEPIAKALAEYQQKAKNDFGSLTSAWSSVMLIQSCSVIKSS